MHLEEGRWDSMVLNPSLAHVLRHEKELVIQFEQRNCRQMYCSHIWLLGGTAAVGHPLFLHLWGKELLPLCADDFVIFSKIPRWMGWKRGRRNP
jgi:hypothetical protein